MKSATPTRLAQFAAPTRGRPKYAPLTAGLLARKGEAVPATAHFAAEAFELFGPHAPQPTLFARAAREERQGLPPLSTAAPSLAFERGHAEARSQSDEPATHRAAAERAVPQDDPLAFLHDIQAEEPPAAAVIEAKPRPSPTLAPDTALERRLDVAPKASLTLELELDHFAALALAARHQQIAPGALLKKAIASFFETMAEAKTEAAP